MDKQYHPHNPTNGKGLHVNQGMQSIMKVNHQDRESKQSFTLRPRKLFASLHL